MKKIVISMDNINRKFRNKDSQNYYALFIEVSNLQVYSQFYDITISSKIIRSIYNDLICLFDKNSVFLYNVDEIIVIQEFANKIIVDKTSRYNEQFRVAQKVINYISSRHYHIGSNSQYYKASLTIGVGSKGLINRENTISSIISLAQFTMIRAKEKKVSLLVANDEIRIIKQDLDTFNKEIENGFKLDEFQPYFIPNVDLKTMQIVGCESLVRWAKDKYRLIEASKFYNIANEKNLLEKIDKKIVDKTLGSYHNWLKKGLITNNFRITLNISKKTLINFQKIIDIIRDYQIECKNIEFDISTNTDFSNEEVETINTLKKYGFKVACDISSYTNILLPLVSNIDIATIKFGNLSQKFKENYDNAVKLYGALIKVGKMLNYQIMIKGIENYSGLQFARDMKVDLAQGYYFTKPLDQNRFALYLEKYQNGFDIN